MFHTLLFRTVLSQLRNKDGRHPLASVCFGALYMALLPCVRKLLRGKLLVKADVQLSATVWKQGRLFSSSTKEL